MTKAEFWQLIADSRKGWKSNDTEGSRKRQAVLLKRLFKPLSANKLIAFERHFRGFHKAAYHWDIWAAAYAFAGGCSDDGFHDFRNWLISMGKDIYEQGMSDADSLVDVFTRPDVETVCFEEFGYVAAQAYEAKTGQEIPATGRKHPSEPTGQRWSKNMKANESELARRFPKVYAAFGDEDE